MQTKLLLVVPLILIAGLVIGVWGIRSAAPAAAACTLGTCPLQLDASENGKTLVYGLATRFSVFLNDQDNPRTHFSISCTPGDAVHIISDAPQPQPPYYALTFQTAQIGSCAIRNDAFSATILVQQ